MKDLFDDIFAHFTPHFEKFENVHEELKQRIQRGIIKDLMNCKTIAEINAIETRDEVFFKEWSELSLHAENAKRRVKNVILTYIDILGIETLN